MTGRSQDTDLPRTCVVDVLDTAALLHWTGERIVEGICSQSQLRELEKLSEPRYLLVSANPPELHIPWEESRSEAIEMAAGTGDLDGLSEVDIDVLALTIQNEATLHTDDYRLQNICRANDIPFKPVNTKGIKQTWKWSLRCTGCRATTPASAESRVGECDVCGSPTELKRSRG